MLFKAVLVACQTFDERGHYVYLPVKERIAAVVQRAIKWSKLRHIPVSERKIAIILHNYPPKNSNIGSAAGLDTPESVLRLLAQLKEEGYLVGYGARHQCRLDGYGNVPHDQ